jgi:glycosyltransferase 2 family protein
MTVSRRHLWKAAQALLLAATLFWAGRALARQWTEVRAVAFETQVQWSWVLLASLIVLATYAALVQSWRMLLAGWGGHLGFWAAARIWTIANLGRYIPGKLWSVGALGVLASKAGVSGVAAAGAAILGTLLNIGAGFGILALSGTRTLDAFDPWLRATALSASVAFVAGVVVLPWMLPPILRRLAVWRGMTVANQNLPARTLWLSTVINGLSWVGYGLAFLAFTRGVAPQVIATPSLFIAIWTASYLIGYLFLFAPGGVVVREVAMAGALVALGLAGPPEATFVALASRLWLTVWELLPGLLALLLARR